MASDGFLGFSQLFLMNRFEFSFKERFLKKAAAAGMDGVKEGNAFILYPKGRRNVVLLEITPHDTASAQFRLVQHRNPELTLHHRGKKVSADWVFRFIAEHANSDGRATHKRNGEPSLKSYRSDSPSQTSANRQPTTRVNQKSSFSREVECPCSGDVENCAFCFGRGLYRVDEHGNPI